MDTFIGLDQGRRIIANGTTKVVKILEGLGEPQIKSEFTSDDYIELYTTIYTMCTQTPPHDYSSQLYANYRDTFQDYLTTKVVPSLREKHGEFMLRELVRRWANHKIMVRWLSRFFDYLHRHYISQRGLPLLSQVSLRCFSDIVYNECKVNARDAVLSLIGREREGEQIDRALLKNVLNVFLEIGSGDTTYNYYVNDFEKSMLKASVDYYSRKASNWIIEDSYADYMIKTDAYLKREKESVAHYLPSSSQEKLLEKVQHELLYVYCPRLLEKKDLGFRDLLIAEKVEDLSMLFRLLLNIPRGVEPVSAIFQTHVIYEGTTLIKQAEDSGSNKKVFVRNVLDLHDKFSAYVNDCFRNHILYRKALKEGFAIVCSKSISGSSCSELIAAYCDTLLKKGASEKLSDEAIEEALENVLKLMTCIVDKDLFGEFYRKKMSQRLLFDKSCNDEHERSFLAKLKQQFGANFTSKMEGMLTDMTLARENQSSFDEYLSQNPGIDFSVTVLTTSFWPRYKTVDLHLPPEMVECVASFREFYKTKAENRKLTFNNSLGTCIVNGRFDAKTIELSVTTHQAATLLLFNDSDKMSFREIATRLNLPDDDVIRLLHSLSCGRYKILNKEPSTKIISRADTFEYNSKFKNEKRKIKVPLPPLNERHKVIEDVDKHRAYTIDASIVRIMKSRKVLGYEQLVSECVEQLNRMFKPDVAAINKRIKRLIERDYLERDKDNNKIIKYLA